MYRTGELISPSAFDSDRLPAGCVYQNGRITRKRKSDRPEDIPSEFWAAATPKLRAQWIEEAIAKSSAPPVPAMPVVFKAPAHRVKNANPHAEYGLTMVARSVGKRELQSSAKAQAALRAEWDALRALLTWDEAKVREWSEVSREGIEKKIWIHVGRIFAIIVEKTQS